MALRLRHYKACDADSIISWIKEEDALRKWSSDRFGSYPITSDDINNKYLGNNGDCIEPDNFYPFTAFDESGAVGHLILRYTDNEKKTIRFGFVIVDDSKRGKGYGRKLLSLAQEEFFASYPMVKKLIGQVKKENMASKKCFTDSGFEEVFTQFELCNHR